MEKLLLGVTAALDEVEFILGEKLLLEITLTFNEVVFWKKTY